MTYRIEVRPEDIAGAGRQTIANCPIARALRRQLPDARAVSVEHERIDAAGPSCLLRCRTTPAIERFIDRWDTRGIAQPAVFLVGGQEGRTHDLGGGAGTRAAGPLAAAGLGAEPGV